VRRRDHIREFLADPDNPRHDHARRVMESYEQEWLAGQPVLLAAMHMVGLFDRPASGSCLQALRKKPVIKGLTDNIVRLKEHEWQPRPCPAARGAVVGAARSIGARRARCPSIGA
jgi:hypothetical protein